MILFSKIYHLLWLVPLLILWLIIFFKQRSAIAWIRVNVSPRFQKMFTRYGKWSLLFHMVFILLMGVLLVVASAGPYSAGMVEKEISFGRIILAIDASFSMVAGDVTGGTSHQRRGEKKSKMRLDQAKKAASRVIEALPSHYFALISFSGVAAIHSPPTGDRLAIKGAVNNLTLHAFQSTGSSMKGALNRIIHMVRHKAGNYQAVIISDGEIPHPDNYQEELEALVKSKVVVHTVAVGTKKGAGIRIFNPDDVRNRVRNRRIARKVRTNRVDDHLKKIAGRTGGNFFIFEEKDSIPELIIKLKKGVKEKALVRKPGKNDRSGFFLFIFFLLFIFETVLLSLCWRPVRQGFTENRIMNYVLIIFLVGYFSTGCGNRLWQAHLINEKGIALYSIKNLSKAQTEFKKSASFSVKEEIPEYNLGNTHLKQGNYSMAHKSYEKAMKMKPDLIEAMYNDGHALYKWGQKEIDPRSLKKNSKVCNVERARKLWQQALKRFERVAVLDKKDGKLREKALRNAEFIKKRLKKLDKIAKKCKGKNKSDNKDKQKDKDKDKSKKDKDKSKKDKDKSKKDKNKNKNKSKKNKSKKDKGKKDKNKEKDKNKNDKDKDGDNGKNKNGKDSDNRSSPRRPPPLSKDEKDKVKKALSRIKKQRKGKFYEQTKQQQIQYNKPGKGKKTKKKGGGGISIWW